MTLDVTLDPDAEKIIIVLDDHKVLKAYKGTTTDNLTFCRNFRELQDEDDSLHAVLRTLVVNLFALN